jgi:phage-related holin
MNADWLLKKIAFVFVWIAVYFSPIYEYLIIVGVLVMADTISGGYAASKNKEFTSKKFRNVIWKSTWYLFAIAVAHMVEIAYDLDLAMKITAGYISFTEMVSIDENYYKITGKHLFKGLIDKLKP